jgi:hypothetical protein
MGKNRKIFLSVIALAVLLVPPVVFAQDFVIYPAKGQSQDQLEKDKFECYQWAKGNTGFDPMAVPTASSAPPPKEEPKGGVGRGAVRGGLTGLAVGAIAGDAGKGAAIGAASGGLIGGMRRSDQNRQQQANQQNWEQQQVNEYAAKRNNYNRNYVACLEGRGYTVK